MNLSEIRARALEQAGESYQTDPEQPALLDQYINKGLCVMCNGRLPKRVSVELNGGSASLCAAQGFTQAEALLDAAGREALFSVRGQMIYARDGLYTLCFLGAPAALSADGDVPEIPAEQHGALSDYAAWRLLGNGGKSAKSRASFFLSRFQLACVACDRWMDALRGFVRFRHKYR